MIRFLKDGDHMGIETDARGEDEFLVSVIPALSKMIESNMFEGDWDFQLDH